MKTKNNFKKYFINELALKRNGFIFEIVVTVIGCAIAAHNQCKNDTKEEKGGENKK